MRNRLEPTPASLAMIYSNSLIVLYRLLFVLYAEARELLPLREGEDLRPWYQENEDRWLIFTRRGISIDTYPAIYAYLLQHQQRLEPKPADWAASNAWQGRKQGSYTMV
jgi:hypothetical protein